MKNTFFVLVFLFINLISFSDNPVIERIEPPFWWSDMKEKNLQLMIHGKNISQLKCKIHGSSFKLIDIKTTENPNYLFLSLRIGNKAKTGKTTLEFYTENGFQILKEYELFDRKEFSSQRQGFDASDVIYLIVPDRFANGNKENDEVPECFEKVEEQNNGGRHGGDLQGIENNLNYLSNLGITTLWLTPVLENNMNRYSYHGYSITDFYKTDPRICTFDQYVNFVKNCHVKNLKVVFDMVFNHCGTNHWWMNDLPSKDWINQHDEFTRSNYRSTTIVDPHCSEYDYDKMVNGWFDNSMPDLNQHNELLAKYLIQNTIWWIEATGIDGLRIDTQPYPFKDFISVWAKAINNEYPNMNFVGEAWLNKASGLHYFQKDANNIDGYNSNFPCIFDFPMRNAINEAFNEEGSWDKGMSKLYELLTDDYLYNKPENLVIFADNHDVERFTSNINGDISKFKMAMTFLLTTRGIPEIFYGTEIMLRPENDIFNHGKIRLDFPSEYVEQNSGTFISENLLHSQNEAYTFLKKLLNWRKSATVIHYGKLIHFIPENDIYVYFRIFENQTIMIILNNSQKQGTIKMNRFAECVKGKKIAFDVINENKLNIENELTISQKSALVLQLLESYFKKFSFQVNKKMFNDKNRLLKGFIFSVYFICNNFASKY